MSDFDKEGVDEGDEEYDNFDADPVEEELEEIRVALKPRCCLWTTIKVLRTNEKVGSVEFDVYKNWFRDAVDEEVEALFDALGRAKNLRILIIISKGSSPQSLPVSLLAHCLGNAESLREFHSEHVKWKGIHDDFEDLAAAFADHTSLRVLKLKVENMDTLEMAIAAAGVIPTLQEVEIETALCASNKEGLAAALQSLCTSKSLRTLKLVNVALKFEILSSMARLLSANNVLEELFIQASELDMNGGMAMAQMLTANTCLQKFILKLDKMHSNKIGEEFVLALDMNSTVNYFQIMLDGRMSDMKVVREMQLHFRDQLRPKYKVSAQLGLTMGVICERQE